MALQKAYSTSRLSLFYDNNFSCWKGRMDYLINEIDNCIVLSFNLSRDENGQLLIFDK